MQAKVYLNFKFFKIFSNLLILERMAILISNNLLKSLETVILPISWWEQLPHPQMLLPLVDLVKDPMLLYQ
jgi:hypothetical protein